MAGARGITLVDFGCCSNLLSKQATILMSMFVYLDESGDPGFRFNHGSSLYFVITLLLIDDPIPVQAAVDELRRELGFGPRSEFKFSHSADDIKERFLRVLRRHDVQIRALVIDKRLMTAPYMRKRETFYNYLIRLILTHDHGTIKGATLVLDESVKSRKRKEQLGSYLRQALNTGSEAPRVRRIVHHASHADNLIQATDMVSGAIYRRYEYGDLFYYRIIAPRVQDLWEWCP